MRRYLIAFVIVAVASCACASTTETYATNVDGAGSPLRWDVYLPASGGPTFTVALVVHGGGYKAGSRGPYFVAQDLAANGFLAIACEYRLAPPHNGSLQVDPPSDGRPPQQTDDVQRAIRAARSPAPTSAAFGKVNGKVVLIGFSGGAAHGAWWAISGTASDDMPDVFVGCSGTYDLDNSDFLADSSSLSLIQNYINHTLGEGTAFHNAAKAASPYWLSIGPTPPPTLLFNSTAETVPSSIYTTMVTKLTNAGGTLESHLRSGTEHANDYWYLGYGGSFSSVKDCVIDFFNRMLNVTQPPPVAAPPQMILR